MFAHALRVLSHFPGSIRVSLLLWESWYGISHPRYPPHLGINHVDGIQSIDVKVHISIWENK